MRKETKRKKEPVLLSSIIDKVLQKAGILSAVRAEQVVQQWETITGSALAQHAQAVRIENGMLFLRAESSAWRNQLFFLKKDLIRKTNEFAGSPLVRDVRFVS